MTMILYQIMTKVCKFTSVWRAKQIKKKKKKKKKTDFLKDVEAQTGK